MRGTVKTRINQIIEKYEVAKGALYYNFKSKTDVLISYTMSDETMMRYLEKETSRAHSTICGTIEQ